MRRKGKEIGTELPVNKHFYMPEPEKASEIVNDMIILSFFRP
jgi:hypothetical protein